MGFALSIVEYNSLHGVRSSFFRFLRGLPADFRRVLLNSIEQRISTYLPSSIGRDATNEGKEEISFSGRLWVSGSEVVLAVRSKNSAQLTG
jgi:hypothetical protein